MEYKIKHIKKSDNNFGKWCIENQLFKEEEGFTSRMKKVYMKEREYESLTVVIAYHKDIPIGIVMCENDESFDNSYLLKDPLRKNSKINESFDWGVYHLGFVSMYVKDEFRNKGIAVDLIKILEKEKLKTLHEIEGLNPLSVAVFQAREKALDLLIKHLEHSHATRLSTDSSNYRYFLHDITHNLIMGRKYGEYDSYSFPQRKKYRK
jgi:GNAT superfamily N-acetyltransferase